MSNLFIIAWYGWKHIPFVCVCVTAAFVSVSCDRLNKINEDRDRIRPVVEETCAKMKIPDEFAQTNTERGSDLGRVFIFKRYRSRMSCDSAKEFFFNYFINEGWDKDGMRVGHSKGGMTTTDFSFKGRDVTVNISCQDNVPSDSDRQFVILCRWYWLDE